MEIRSSYLHNGISYTGKTTSLYWIRAQRTISPVVLLKLDYYRRLGNHHYCCCLGCSHHRDITSHAIDDAGQTGPWLPQGRISTTCAISMVTNDRKCKYIFIFPTWIHKAQSKAKFLPWLLNPSLPAINDLHMKSSLHSGPCSTILHTAMIEHRPDMQLTDSHSWPAWGTVCCI